jgi:hypothetical protein
MSSRNRNQLPPPVEPPLPALYPDETIPPEFLEDMNGVNLDDIPVDVMNDLPADPEVRRAEPVLKPTGAFMNLDFIDQINNAPTDEEAKAMYDALDPALRHVYDRSYGMEISPKWAADTAQEFYQMQDRLATQAADPVRQQSAAKGQVEVAEKQREVQQQYLQEMQYQRHIATLNDPSATRAQRASAINAIDGLATAIGQRMVKGTAGTITADAKRAAGTVSSRIPLLGVNAAEYNPLNLVMGKNADYGAQLGTMLQGSQERMGVIRQQMEAAGIPVPEMPNAAQPADEQAQERANRIERTINKNGVKGPDGAVLMIDGLPVINGRDLKTGEPLLMKLRPNGKATELTEAERAQLPQ